MTIQEAIMGFSQSEKLKSGIIWISQSIEMTHGMSDIEKQGVSKLIKTLLDMIAQEVNIARRMHKEDAWAEAEKHIDKAIVMVNSNVLHESTFHLTNALSQVTTIGQRALQFLMDEGLISL